QGNSTDRNPGKVTALEGKVSAIAAGSQHNLALDVDGYVWAWGSNSYGRLGNGTTTTSQTPVQALVKDSTTPFKITDLYTISLDSDKEDFGTVLTGYSQPAAKTITITNAADSYKEATVDLPTAESYVITAGTGFNEGKAVIAPGATATFTIQPKAGLAAGTYNETIAVTGSNGAAASVAASFTVNPKDLTLTFETNGGSAIDSVTVEEGQKVDLTQYVTTRQSFEFTGWYSDIELKNAVTEITMNDDATVYAGWKWINPFTDVKENNWFHEHVAYVFDKGLMNGTSATTFDPNGVTTRAMVVTTLWRSAGEPEPSGNNTFSDVEADKWYTKAVMWAADKGIAKGYENGRFGINDPVSREQMVTFFYRYAEFTGANVSQRAGLDKFSDKDSVSSYATEAMEWSVAVGLIEGDTSGTLRPKDGSKRSEFAAVLHRYSEAF
ncbi:MAG: S-layer homology domain-containing protein, partial [Bacillota bacterium]|nr:S-layer homology domain-containing protein [Bacillota bacterium]